MLDRDGVMQITRSNLGRLLDDLHAMALPELEFMPLSVPDFVPTQRQKEKNWDEAAFLKRFAMAK